MKPLDDIGAKALGAKSWALLRSPASDQLGDELKQMFAELTAGPLPDRMLQLADALEEAFRRGDLFDTGPRRIS